MLHFSDPLQSFFKHSMILWQHDSLSCKKKARTNILENSISNIMTSAGFE